MRGLGLTDLDLASLTLEDPVAMFTLGAGLLVCLIMLVPDPPAPKPEAVTLTGTVVELTAALKDLGVPADPEPVAQQVVLKGDDGTLTPLLSDPASRALFLDQRLRRQARRGQGEAVPGAAVPPGRRVPGRGPRRIPHARVLLRRLHHQRTLSAGLPVLPGADGAADAAR